MAERDRQAHLRGCQQEDCLLDFQREGRLIAEAAREREVMVIGEDARRRKEKAGQRTKLWAQFQNHKFSRYRSNLLAK